MAKKHLKVSNESTESRIRDAARRLFTEKGFDATRTREIAEEAGINLALLNYYFRSKQKLYNMVMEENMASFKHGLAELFGNPSLDVFTKVEKLATYYIDEFIANRDLPMFILSTINHKTHIKLMDLDNNEVARSRKIFMGQIRELAEKKKIKPIHPVHFLSNLMSLVMFPFAASPILKSRANISDKEFVSLMQERKKMIPIWIRAMLEK